MKFIFAKDAWTMEGLVPAYSARFTATPQFLQREDCIENPPEPTSKDGYSYISLLTKEKVKPSVRLKTRCYFEGAAAPLIVLARELYEENGVMRYNNYLEVVLYKNGINVWDLWSQEDGTVKWHKVLGVATELQEGVIYELEMRITEDRFFITLGGMEINLLMPRIYPDFHLGITGCEGVCRFYDMTIEPCEEK